MSASWLYPLPKKNLNVKNYSNYNPMPKQSPKIRQYKQKHLHTIIKNLEHYEVNNKSMLLNQKE